MHELVECCIAVVLALAWSWMVHCKQLVFPLMVNTRSSSLVAMLSIVLGSVGGPCLAELVTTLECSIFATKAAAISASMRNCLAGVGMSFSEMLQSVQIQQQPQAPAEQQMDYTIGEFADTQDLNALYSEQMAARPAESMKRYGRAFTQVTRNKDMPVLVMHGEVRKERTCQYGRTVFQGPFCGNLRECIVCQALNNSVTAHGDRVAIQQYAKTLQHVMDNLGSFSGSPRGAFEALVAYWEDKPDVRKPLSHYGAVRVERGNALQVLEGPESLNNYYIWISRNNTKRKSDGGIDTNYVFLFYHDYGNAIMANWFSTLNIASGGHLNQENKGDVTEAALALGWMHKHASAAQRATMSFVADMVDYIETGLDEYMHFQGQVPPVPKPVVLSAAVSGKPLAQVLESMGYGDQGQAASSSGPVDKQSQDAVNSGLALQWALITDQIQALNQKLDHMAQTYSDNQQRFAGEIQHRITEIMDKLGSQTQDVTMTSDAKGYADVPDFSEDERKAMDDFLLLGKNGEASWIKDKNTIQGGQYNKEDLIMREAQKESYYSLKDPASKGIIHHNGWVPWGYLFQHLKNSPAFGARFDEAQFWQIMATTVNNKDPSHAVYIIKEVHYEAKAGQEEATHIILKQRPYDKGYYSSGGKRQRYGGYGGGQSQGYGGGQSQSWGQSSKAQN